MTAVGGPGPEEKAGEVLKRAWLRQLRREYGQLLARPALKRLRPAVLALSAAGDYLGQWRPATRSIVISERLIQGSSWAVVQGVLAHETAHQIAGELFGPRTNLKARPHGESFQAACDLLGLYGPYRRPRLNLAELNAPAAAPAAELKALELVKKLLALAASPARAEAEAAMLKAAQIMARHNLAPGPEAGPADYQLKIINTGRKRLSALQARLAGLLAEFYFVEVILSSIYNPRLDIQERTLEIYGRVENLVMAEYVYDFILTSLNRLWPEAKRAGLKSRHSFSLGLVEGFQAKLKSHNQRLRAGAPDLAGPPEASVSALVLAADLGLKSFIKRRHPRLRLANYQGRAQEPSSRRAGFQAGLGLVVNRPLTASGSGAVAGLLE